MSTTKIPPRTTIRMWLKAAGRCEFEGCNDPLWRDTLTMQEINQGLIGHIVSDSPLGPRGDATRSPLLAKEFSNLMLLCGRHHALVDDKSLEAEYPESRLLAMKGTHETRIEMLTAIAPEKRSAVVLYGAKIGEHDAPLSFEKSARAMSPNWYPLEPRPIELGLKNNARADADSAYWSVEAENVRALVAARLLSRLADGSVPHLSIFALAPQPLLVLFGHLLSDIPAAEVFQLHREPPDWRWQDHPEGFKYTVNVPSQQNGSPALILSLSATITLDRVERTLGGTKFTPWIMSVPTPNNDFLKSREQLQEFRRQMRLLLDGIKAMHGEKEEIHVFPAIPVATAIELGRIHMPKADLPLRIYDQNSRNGGFTYALTVGSSTSAGAKETKC